MSLCLSLCHVVSTSGDWRVPDHAPDREVQGNPGLLHWWFTL